MTHIFLLSTQPLALSFLLLEDKISFSFFFFIVPDILCKPYIIAFKRGSSLSYDFNLVWEEEAIAFEAAIKVGHRRESKGMMTSSMITDGPYNQSREPMNGPAINFRVNYCPFVLSSSGQAPSLLPQLGSCSNTYTSETMMSSPNPKVPHIPGRGEKLDCNLLLN